MSVSDKEKSNVGGSGGGGGFNGDDDDNGCGVHARRGGDDDDDANRKKQRAYDFKCGGWCSRDFTKARKVVLHPFTKAKKFFLTRKKKRASSTPASVASGKRFGCGGSGGGKGCFFCFTKPQTLESPAESQTSDPNDPNFTYEKLKALIEKNDFYSKECNPQLDFDAIE